MILITKHELTSRSSLWSTTASYKYMDPPDLVKTVMARDRFDDLFSCLTWSEQPIVWLASMSQEIYIWLLIDGFAKEINDYRASHFSPSDFICVDESISRWYGQGGHWISHGLPMYVAIDGKPENGCEIQNECCGRSSIMMRIKLVKTSEEELTHTIPDAETGLLHSTCVLLYLISSCTYSLRTIVGD